MNQLVSLYCGIVITLSQENILTFLIISKKLLLKNEFNNITININNMDLTKLSKKELLAKCEENEIIKCKSKTKKELISLLQNKLNEPSINIDATNIEIENICGIEYFSGKSIVQGLL